MNKCDPKAIKDQVKRTEGQVLSLGRMIDDTRPCAEVLQQIVAARASLSKLGTMLLEAEAQGCLGEANAARAQDLEKVLSSLFKIT
ncbi:MAG: metal-sensitive transcriptional regulator [Candidatus Veblenbacteria bacterium]|nr:metal-sensitive transcriptional regulator [Candidatus Veblenbacteria bacterium]